MQPQDLYLLQASAGQWHKICKLSLIFFPGILFAWQVRIYVGEPWGSRVPWEDQFLLLVYPCSSPAALLFCLAWDVLSICLCCDLRYVEETKNVISNIWLYLFYFVTHVPFRVVHSLSLFYRPYLSSSVPRDGARVAGATVWIVDLSPSGRLSVSPPASFWWLFCLRQRGYRRSVQSSSYFFCRIKTLKIIHFISFFH